MTVSCGNNPLKQLLALFLRKAEYTKVKHVSTHQKISRHKENWLEGT